MVPKNGPQEQAHTPKGMANPEINGPTVTIHNLEFRAIANWLTENSRQTCFSKCCALGSDHHWARHSAATAGNWMQIWDYTKLVVDTI